MRGDDYVGSFIIKGLMKAIHTEKVIFFDAEDGIEWVTSKIAQSRLRRLIILDACEMHANPGEVKLIPLAKTEYPFFTTHGIPLKLIVSKLLSSVETWVLAIQPGRMALNERLTPMVQAAADSISNVVAGVLKEGG
jgi:hydrogenase maturation protease